MASLIQQSTAEKKLKSGGAQKAGMQQYIKQMEGEIKKALPSVMTPERFTRIVLSALSTTPKLQECTPQSFLGAMMTAAQLGMEPNTPLGQAYLIPYYNSKKQCFECQFQLGYKGLIDLAYRSGEVSTIQSHIVYANDKFSYSFGLEPTLNHVPAVASRGEPTHVYAIYRTRDGGYGYDVMSLEDVRNHARKYSKSFNSGPWQTNFEEMAKKTILKRVLKYAPLKTDFARQLSADDSVKTEISDDMFSVPTYTVVEAAEYSVSDETGEAVPMPEEERRARDAFAEELKKRGETEA